MFERLAPNECNWGSGLRIDSLVGDLSRILFGDTMVPQYRVRLYPPFGV